MTDCFKTRAPNSEASRPTASDSNTPGYFKDFSSCSANDGTPITADWANSIIDALTEIVAAAKAADGSFDDNTCSNILVRAIAILAPGAGPASPSEVIIQNAALSGGAPAGAKLGYSRNEEKLYHVTATGNWSEIPLGGGALPGAQTFDSSGTWTKPDDGTALIIEMWGAGAGGGASAGGSSRCGGGGGGSYIRVTIPFSELGATENFVIGAGGAEGVDGGHSTFAGYIAPGGKAGGSGTSSPPGGLGGGNVGGASDTFYYTAYMELGGVGGAGAPTGAVAPTTGVGSQTANAGAGGSGGTTNIGGSAANNLPGIAHFKGGDGGQGGAGDRDPADGQHPGGGGGGRSGGRASGSGAGGRIIITVI